MSLRVLIIGGSGLIGRRLFHALGPNAATATYHTRPFPGGAHFDGTSMPVRSLLGRGERYTHAFVLQGLANIDACARDPSGTARTNVDGVCSVIDQLVAEGVCPVFASSDAVFDGSRGAWTETDPVSPVLTYGAQKAAVEAHLAALPPPWLAVRLAKVVTSDPAEPGMIAEWMDRLEAGAEIHCARDQVFSPVDVEDVVAALIALAEQRCSGVYHLCGPAPLSRLEFLRLLVEAVREHRDVSPRIVECSLRDLRLAEPRPLNASMSGAKMERVLGRRMKDMRTVCREAAARRYGRPRPQAAAAAADGARA